MKKDVRKLEFYGVTVYIWENIQVISQEEVMRLLETLPRWRQNKAFAIRNESVRRESVLSFALLLDALETKFGISGDLDVAYAEHGKPALVHYPDIHFNMSHCCEAVACVVGKYDVGIDVERRGRYNATLAQYVLNGNELRKIHNTSDIDLAFTSLWTKKEALLKMTGEGVGSKINKVLNVETQCGISTFVAAKYVCSVAVSKENPVDASTG